MFLPHVPLIHTVGARWISLCYCGFGQTRAVLLSPCFNRPSTSTVFFVHICQVKRRRVVSIGYKTRSFASKAMRSSASCVISYRRGIHRRQSCSCSPVPWSITLGRCVIIYAIRRVPRYSKNIYRYIIMPVIWSITLGRYVLIWSCMRTSLRQNIHRYICRFHKYVVCQCYAGMLGEGVC